MQYHNEVDTVSEVKRIGGRASEIEMKRKTGKSRDGNHTRSVHVVIYLILFTNINTCSFVPH